MEGSGQRDTEKIPAPNYESASGATGSTAMDTEAGLLLFSPRLVLLRRFGNKPVCGSRRCERFAILLQHNHFVGKSLDQPRVVAD